MADGWSNFPDAAPPRQSWNAFPDAIPGGPTLAATGELHDGDTFRLNGGVNGRLYGVDAFELNQTGKSPTGEIISLGKLAKRALEPFARPDAGVLPIGGVTYGRPVVTLNNGGDAGSALLRSGMAVAAPEYLTADPEHLHSYMEDERFARQNRVGAFADTFQFPSAFRRGAPEPWAEPGAGKFGDRADAVFWDEATPFQGLRRDIADGYVALSQNPRSTAQDLIAYAQKNGFEIGRADAEKFVTQRNAGANVSDDVQYQAPPRVLTDLADGRIGATLRGIADPINFLDEAGGVIDALGGTPGRESVWNSDRRFGDILHNNIDQNRSIVANDEANYPWYRIGGQIGSGILVPGASVEGVGARAAAKALEEGSSNFAANQLSQAATKSRLMTIGGIEGALAGAGSGEGWRDRLSNSAVGAAAGTGLGLLSGLALPAARATIAKIKPGRLDAGAVDGARAMVSGTAPSVDASVPIGGEMVPNGAIDAPLPNSVMGLASTSETRAGNILLHKLESPEDIDAVLQATASAAADFRGARRGAVSHEETAALATDLGMTADDLLRRRKGQALNAEQALAARRILGQSATELVGLARKAAGGSDADLSAFRQAWVRHGAIQEQVSGATAEAGRALSQFRMTARAGEATSRVHAAIVDNAGGREKIEDVARAIVDLERETGDPAKVNSFALKALKPRWSDKLVELYYNSILSGPQTHAANVISNTLTVLGQIPEHAVASGLGALRSGAADRVAGSEIGARAVGLLQGIKEGLGQAGRTLRTGMPSDFSTKIETRRGEAIGGIPGKIIRTPTRFLEAEDELFKAIGRRMELSGLAVRQARSEGLTGDAFKSRVSSLASDPTDAMLDKAMDYGKYLTFQTPLGPLGQKIASATDAAPILKLVLPFVRTPTNILKFAIERSPAAPVLKEWRADIAAGGARRDLAASRMLVGTGIGALAMQWAAEGKITGGGPADESAGRLLRADGWQPYSVKVGDSYYSYQRLDPYATVLGVAADMAAKSDYMTDEQRDHAAALVTAAVMKNLGSKTWLSGIGDLSNAIDDPDRFAGAWLSRIAGSITVPALVSQIERATDPTVREAHGPVETINGRIPGLSTTLPARRDIWGKPIAPDGAYGPDIGSPIWMSRRLDDPTNKALLEAGARVSQPSRRVGGRELSAVDYGRYQELAGGAAKSELDAVIGGPVWPTLSIDDRKDLTEQIVRTARKGARTALPSATLADEWSAFPSAAEF